ncbi:putative GPI anchored endo-1,3(4)-beta-glucanase [Aspergillus mulundensis]|uniref:endo-1,3(4)-beta-glucanase n=1 Tax=Aspergillus mulundensis TaxID=1810919 RepID=A0A3D8RY32_9EURO|nr:Endo-1,3(4)-beta-glucanase xgeA [Aspergillus mulundensis]RDW78926.1 Endo-1,3(4)-beta-glucanase xgeA [Aspergillus mulundensis]
MPSMMRKVGSLAASAIIFPGIAHATGTYKLQESWEGEKILNHFNFFDGADPTNGFVTYVNQSYAETAGLVKTTDSGSLYLGVDYETVLTADGPGRESVRIESNEYYDQGLYVVDIQHMPGSICGTWPAFWTVGPDWPTDGEIDIIEGVNKHEANEIVLHTSGTCDVGGGFNMTGTMTSSECGEASGTIGCVVKGQQGSSGDPFNENGGGVYAMEWQEEYLKIWYFPRSSIPESLAAGTPDVTTFGTPMAHLQGSCNFKERFTHQKLILDTTFCGDWAGGVFGDSGCPVSDASNPIQSCVNYVAENPAEYKNAYWELNSIKIYQIGGTAEVAGADSATTSTAAAAETTAAQSTASSTQNNGGSIEEITTSTHSVTRTETVSTSHSTETAAATAAATTAASAPSDVDADAANAQTTKTKSTSYVTSTTTLCPVESSTASAVASESTKTKTTSFVTLTTTLCPVESLQTANAVPSAEASTEAAAVPSQSSPEAPASESDNSSSANAVTAQSTETAPAVETPSATSAPDSETETETLSIPPDSIIYTAPNDLETPTGTGTSSVPLFTIISSSSAFVTVPTAEPSSYEPTDVVPSGVDADSTASPTAPSNPVFTGLGSKLDVSVGVSAVAAAVAMMLLV